VPTLEYEIGRLSLTTEFHADLSQSLSERAEALDERGADL
jgi:hypothetical protein